MTVVERGCQILIKDRTWERMPGIHERAERLVRAALERDGCTGIRLSEPWHHLIEPNPDLGQDFTPYWAWEINAVGRKQEAL